MLAHGFAHNILEGKVFDNGFFKGKKAMLSFTGGSDKDSYYNNIPNDDKTKLLPPVSLVLRFTGLELIDAFAYLMQ